MQVHYSPLRNLIILSVMFTRWSQFVIGTPSNNEHCASHCQSSSSELAETYQVRFALNLQLSYTSSLAEHQFKRTTEDLKYTALISFHKLPSRENILQVQSLWSSLLFVHTC